MTFGFLFLTIGLFISVIVLVRNLAIGNRRVSDLPSVFKSETQHLSFILIFFSFTYMVRFIFDYWVTPAITNQNSLYPCIRDDGLPTVCGSSYSIEAYLWLSVLWDFMPLFVIVYFHHKSFRHDSIRRGT